MKDCFIGQDKAMADSADRLAGKTNPTGTLSTR